ncbi:MAG: right-handed parallel beta-helix repeat-containing protein [Thermoplasmatota archaeon]
MAGFSTLGFMGAHDPIGEAEGLDITGLTVLNTNTNYYENVTIKSGGILRIMPGVTVGMAAGCGIYVEDGRLEALGQPNNRARIQTLDPDLWNGIYANEDSTVLISWGEIRFAERGLDLMGTGHSGSAGSVKVNYTVFTTCTRGLSANANGYSSPFDLQFKNNSLSHPDYAVYLENAYHGVSIENNRIYSAKKSGIYTNGVGSVHISNNTFTECHYAVQAGMTDTEIIVENNTVYNCYVGFLGVFLGNAKFLNNSLFTRSKGIFMPLVADLLIENNTVTSINGKFDIPIEIYDDSGGLSTIKNNILSGSGPMIMANSSSPANFDIYDNLLLNLSEVRYIDSTGDGFVDIPVPCAGTSGARARSCRTSVFYVNQPGIVESYVTPKQASEHARVGSTLKMISNPAGYGPKNLERREIYHTLLPVIEWPMNFTGEEKENLIFYPGTHMNYATVDSTYHSGLSNFTVRSGPVSVKVVGSHNVTLSNIDCHTYDLPVQAGISVIKSRDVTIRNCITSYSFLYGINIGRSERVVIRDTSIWIPQSIGVNIQDSSDIKADNVSVRISNDIGIRSNNSQIYCNGSEIMGKNMAVILEESYDSTFSNCEFRTPDTASETVVIEDTRNTLIEGSMFHIGYKNSDIYGLHLTRDAQGTVVESCLFSGDEGHLNTIAGIFSDGNISGSRFLNSTFQHTTAGIVVGASGNIANTDLIMNGNLFAKNQYGIITSYYGDLTLSNCTIGQGDIGAHITRTELSAEDLSMYQVDQGLLSMHNHFTVRNSHINADVESINTTDTDGSRVVDTTLFNIPISLNLNSDTENHVSLDNCTGEQNFSKIKADGCYANWTWPLQVNVWDEIGMPQPSILSVSSPTFGEVYNDSMDGTQRVDHLLGWWTDISGNHDVSDYTVTVQDAENSETDHPTMLSYQISEFVFNHRPKLTFAALHEIELYEDEIWSEDISDWFTDRDTIVIELDSVAGPNVSASLDGSTLTVTNSDQDLYGDGSLQLTVTDTFDEELLHEVEVHILPVNDPPVVDPIPAMNLSEDGQGWMNLSGYVSDVDSSNLTFSNATANNFTIQWTGPMNFTLIPDPDWYGTQNITLRVTDGEHVVDAVLVVNITPVNDAPVWSGDPVIDVTVDAGEEETIDIDGLFSDVDDELEDLTITFDSEQATYSGGKVTLDYPPDTGNMTEMITATISDGDLETTFAINVTVIERQTSPDDWTIEDSRVEVDPQTGDWNVSASGGEGQDVYIVIDGLGSYKLEETSPGEYSIIIPASEFEDGTEYDYHFSDTEGGDDMTGGAHTGSVNQPVIGDDDVEDDDVEDDDEEKDDGIPGWIILLGIIILILVAVIAFLMLSNPSKPDYYDEELDEE